MDISVYITKISFFLQVEVSLFSNCKGNINFAIKRNDRKCFSSIGILETLQYMMQIIILQIVIKDCGELYDTSQDIAVL